jgi:GDPmannose 4,6-dehydratase
VTTALILGVNGQDGSYLAESLLGRGIAVVGVGHRDKSRHVAPQSGFTYVKLDLTQSDELAELVERAAPDLAFHVAAVHGAIGAGFTYEEAWRDMMRVNVFALHVLLEHARLRAPDMTIVYAGSSKVFPTPLAGLIDETTETRASCLYSVGKLAARDLMREYRRTHGLKTTNLILFNHDSPRRPRQFFLPIVATTIAESLRDRAFTTRLRTLDFRIDWSAADEIMDIVVDMALRGAPHEVVMASGRTVYAREVVSAIFRRYGLEARRHLLEDLAPAEPGPEFVVGIDRLVEASGRRPRKTAPDIVDDILEAQRNAPSVNRGLV